MRTLLLNANAAAAAILGLHVGISKEEYKPLEVHVCLKGLAALFLALFEHCLARGASEKARKALVQFLKAGPIRGWPVWSWRGIFCSHLTGIEAHLVGA